MGSFLLTLANVLEYLLCTIKVVEQLASNHFAVAFGIIPIPEIFIPNVPFQYELGIPQARFVSPMGPNVGTQSDGDVLEFIDCVYGHFSCVPVAPE